MKQALSVSVDSCLPVLFKLMYCKVILSVVFIDNTKMSRIRLMIAGAMELLCYNIMY